MNPLARAWSRIANQKRMEKVTPERRREIARIAAMVRWARAREVDSGTLEARPVGVDGQWYLATDVGAGTLYLNSGGTWVQASQAVRRPA